MAASARRLASHPVGVLAVGSSVSGEGVSVRQHTVQSPRQSLRQWEPAPLAACLPCLRPCPCLLTPDADITPATAPCPPALQTT